MKTMRNPLVAALVALLFAAPFPGVARAETLCDVLEPENGCETIAGYSPTAPSVVTGQGHLPSHVTDQEWQCDEVSTTFTMYGYGSADDTEDPLTEVGVEVDYCYNGIDTEIVGGAGGYCWAHASTGWKNDYCEWSQYAGVGDPAVLELQGNFHYAGFWGPGYWHSLYAKISIDKNGGLSCTGHSTGSLVLGAWGSGCTVPEDTGSISRLITIGH